MKALVVFVEGQADTHYVLRSLGRLAGAEFDTRKPIDMPTPFGRSQGQGRGALPQGQQNQVGLILSWNQRAVANSQLGDRTIAASAEDHEPVFQVAVKFPTPPAGTICPDLAFIVRMGGDRKATEVKRLLADFDVSFTSNLNHDVTRVACAFVFDADTPSHYRQTVGDCVQLREQRFATEYASALGSLTPPGHSQWSRATIPMGLFILHDAQTRSGTLEHLVEPALRQDLVWLGRINDAEQLLTTHENQIHPIFDRTGAARFKARITIAGQWHEPGSSLAQILRRGDPRYPPVVPDSVFTSTDAQALVTFLMSAPW